MTLAIIGLGYVGLPLAVEFAKRRTADGKDTYQEWFEGLRDPRVKIQILRRINRIELGNLGDQATRAEGRGHLRQRHA